MTPDEIMKGIQEKNRMLTIKNSEYAVLVEKRASAERDYQIALATTITKMKIDGQAATLIPNLAKGDRIVSDLKYKFDVAEGIERACLESIKDIRSAIDSYRSLLAWNKAELLRAE